MAPGARLARLAPEAVATWRPRADGGERGAGATLEPVSDRPVLVLRTASVPEGEIARSRLEDEGIPVMVTGLDSPYRLGPVHVFVPASFEVQARLVLESTVAPFEERPDGADDEMPMTDGDAADDERPMTEPEAAEPDERG